MVAEAKLRKLKANPDLLKQLQEKREACMNQLLNSDPISFGPLSQEEEVELIKHDQLSE